MDDKKEALRKVIAASLGTQDEAVKTIETLIDTLMLCKYTAETISRKPGLDLLTKSTLQVMAETIPISIEMALSGDDQDRNVRINEVAKRFNESATKDKVTSNAPLSNDEIVPTNGIKIFKMDGGNS